MKKIVMFGLLFCSIFLMLGGKQLSAEVPPHYFLPDGENYLNPENIYYTPTDGDYEGVLASRSDIRVKQGVTYFIYCINCNEVVIDYQTVNVWDDQTEDLVEIESENEGSFIYFTMPIGCDRVSIEFGVININRSDNIHIWDVGANYVMAEEGTVDQAHLNSYAFNGYDLVDKSIVEGTIQINTVASNPTTYQNIVSNLYIYDYVDGTITNQKQVIEDTYSTSNYQVGDYTIIFSVKNSRNISNSLTININVADDIAPVITGPTEYIMKNINMKTLDDVKMTLTAEDNFDGDLTTCITIDESRDSFTNRQTELGTFPVTFTVRDAKGNVGEHVVNVVVEQGDFTAPVFSGTFSRELPTNSPMTTAQLLSDIKAIDDYSGDVTNRIQVIYDDYKYNTNRIGNYRLTLEVYDNAGNRATKDINITVYDVSAPSFVIANTIIYLPLKSNMEDIDDIVGMLQRMGYLTDDEYTITNDGYSDNKKVLGSYTITLEQNDEVKNVIVNVEGSIEYLNCIELPKTVEYDLDLSGRPAFLNMIYDVCCRVKAFFKDFFSSII